MMHGHALVDPFPYVMAHYAFSGLSRNSQGSAVLVDSSKLFGTVHNLTTRASRVAANLYNRGHHLASSAQEIITVDQPISEANGLMIGTATANDITSGMSPSTTLTTAARDLGDYAIQAIISMVPTSILQNSRPPHPTHGHIIAIHTVGSLFPRSSPGAISAHWPVVQESPAHHLAHLHCNRIGALIHELTHT
jgi:hypothetical protein